MENRTDELRRQMQNNGECSGFSENVPTVIEWSQASTRDELIARFV